MYREGVRKYGWLEECLVVPSCCCCWGKQALSSSSLFVFLPADLLNAIVDPYSSLIQPSGQRYRVKHRAAGSGSGAGSRLIGWADSGGFSQLIGRQGSGVSCRHHWEAQSAHSLDCAAVRFVVGDAVGITVGVAFGVCTVGLLLGGRVDSSKES